MNEFEKMLERLSHGVSSDIGFGVQTSSSKKTPLLLGAWFGEKTKSPSKCIDFGIVKTGERLSKSPEGFVWGGVAGAGADERAQFLLVTDGSCSANILNRVEEVPVGYALPGVCSESLKCALEELPFAFLYLDKLQLKPPFNVDDAISLASIISELSHHIMLYLDCTPQASDLVLLRDLSVSAVVVDADKLGWEEVATISNLITQVAPRETKSSKSGPLLPNSEHVLKDLD